MKYYARTLEHVCKEKQYITDVEHLIDGKICDEKELFWLQVQKVGYEKALMDYTNKFSRKAFSSSNVSSLRRNFKDMEDLKNTLQDDVLTTLFTFENFKLQGALKECNETHSIY